MDLNYLFQRHQISLFRSQHAPCPQAREAHRGLTLGYAAEIARSRTTTGYRLMPVS